MSKKKFWIFFETVTVLFWVAVAIRILIIMFSHPLKHSAWAMIANSNLLLSLLAVIGIFAITDFATTLIAVLIMEIDSIDADIFMSQSSKLNFIVSVTCGLLLTEDSDNFQLIATTISFILVFQYFFPKEFKKTLTDIQVKFVKKWHTKSKNKEAK